MDVLGVRRIPFLSRRNFVAEFQHILPWSVLAGVVEGQFASVVVAKTFQGGPLLVSLATATPYASYMLSLIWGMLCVGRSKLRLMSYFAWGTAICAAFSGFLPKTPSAGLWFIAQIGCAQSLLAGVVTVRSAIWRANYPRAVRGQITSRLQGARSIISVLTIQASAALCDKDPEAYRYVFPIAAAFGGLGAMMLSRIRVRGEQSLVRHPRKPMELRGGLPTDLMEPFSLTALLSPGQVLGQAVDILKGDRKFAVYCVAQFLHGAGNLMTIPLVVLVVTQLLDADESWGFWISSSLIVSIPTLCLLGSVGRWGRLFDDLGVLRFRVINVICWVCSVVFGLAGTLVVLACVRLGPGFYPVAVALFALRGLAQGVGQGGGTLAWNLGHLHFADSGQAELYMGIHVFLAGVRGLIAPLGGMALWTLVGWWAWVIALALSLSSLIMYASLARSER